MSSAPSLITTSSPSLWSVTVDVEMVADLATMVFKQWDQNEQTAVSAPLDERLIETKTDLVAGGGAVVGGPVVTGAVLRCGSFEGVGLGGHYRKKQEDS